MAEHTIYTTRESETLRVFVDPDPEQVEALDLIEWGAGDVEAIRSICEAEAPGYIQGARLGRWVEVHEAILEAVELL